MKYLRLFENFEDYDPYELMIIPPNKKAEMIIEEIKKSKPNLNLIQDLITLGANLDWQDEENYGRTPLHWAAKNGIVEIVRMLIGAKADLNVKDNRGCTPLHWAAEQGRVEVTRMLIDAGADLNVKDKVDGAPLHFATYYGKVEIARMLIDAGADVDAQDNGDWTPLHIAAYDGRVKIVRMLLDAGARKDIRDEEGRLPYDLTNNQELKKLLKPNLSESFDSHDPYELMIIPPNKKAEMIIEEIKKWKPNLNLVSDLIVLGANLEWQDEDGVTPLHKAIRWDKVEIARMLIEAQADVNVQDKFNRTPLREATWNGQVEIVKMLIGAGARKDIRDDEGKLPYDFARTEELKKLLKP